MVATNNEPQGGTTESSSGTSESSTGIRGAVEDAFYAYVGHLSFLLEWPGKYYRDCVEEGKRCVKEGKRRMQKEEGETAEAGQTK